MMLAKLDSAFKKISEAARKDGAEAEVLATSREGLSITAEKKALGKFSSNLSLAAGVRVIVGGAEGYSSTENLSDEALMGAYEEALANAQFNAANGVADRDMKMIGKQSGYRSFAAADFEIDPMELDAKIQKTIALESECLALDNRISVVAYNGYGEQKASVRVFNTNGVDATYSDAYVSAYAYPLAKQGEESRMAGETFVSHDPSAFHPSTLAKEATERALSKLGSTQPLTGRYPVLLEREPAEALLGMFLGYLSGKRVYDKQSFYDGKLGTTIASPVFTMIDDPFLENGLGSRPFDSEGMPSQTLPMIEKGILKSYMLNSIYARKLGMKNTAHASRSPMGTLNIGSSNTVVKPGSRTREELIRSRDRIVVITDITGLHAGFQEGSSDFSFQAEGELWENGKRVGPLSDFVLSGNLREMMTQIEDVASLPTDAKITGSIVTPELLIRELSIAGKNP